MDLAAYNTGPICRASSPATGVLLITLSKEKKLNAFDEPAWQDLRRVFELASRDNEVAVVVLCGKGRAFSSGLDVTAFAAPESDDVGRKALHWIDHIKDFQACISSIEACRKPVIAAMHGLTLGLGIDIASAADVRYCASDTTFAILEVQIGLAADIGSLQRLPKITGNESLARELALTGRNFDGEEARTLGFVSKVVPGSQEAVVAEAVQLASTIATRSPLAVVGTKHLLNHARDHTTAEGLDYTAIWNASMLQSQDVTDAIMARMQKKQAKFAKL